MKYFVTNQNRQLSIQDWEMDMTGNPAFELLNAEQLAYHEMYPEASPWEVKNLAPRPVPIPAPSIEQLRQWAKDDLSQYSLMTSQRVCKDYQLSNALSSLDLPDGQGIYSHEKAQEIINTYTTVGKLCRTKYYEAGLEIDGCNTEEDINTVVSTTKAYYDNLITVNQI